MEPWPELLREIEANECLRDAWTVAANRSCDMRKIAKYAYTYHGPFYGDLNSDLRQWFASNGSNIRSDRQLKYQNYIKLLESQVVRIGRNRSLWRCVPVKMSDMAIVLNKNMHMVSNQFSSCSSEEPVARNHGSRIGCYGTLFEFRADFAIDVRKDSFFPNESEYIIPPGMQFSVIQCRHNANGMDRIILQQIYVKIFSALRNDMALTCYEPVLKFEKLAKDNKQIWFHQGQYLLNRATGKTLDIDQPGPFKMARIKSGHKVWNWSLHGQCNQEWFHLGPNNHIMCGIDGLVLAVDNNDLENGKLIVDESDECDRHKFRIVPIAQSLVPNDSLCVYL